MHISAAFFHNNYIWTIGSHWVNTSFSSRFMPFFAFALNSRHSLTRGIFRPPYHHYRWYEWKRMEKVLSFNLFKHKHTYLFGGVNNMTNSHRPHTCTWIFLMGKVVCKSRQKKIGSPTEIIEIIVADAAAVIVLFFIGHVHHTMDSTIKFPLKLRFDTHSVIVHLTITILCLTEIFCM